MKGAFFTVRLLNLTRSRIHLLQSVLAMLLILSFSFSGIIRAQEYEAKERVETKEATGRLSSRSPISTPNYIGITLVDGRGNDTNHDMFFFADKDLRVSNKRKFSDIQLGDTVRVIYNEIFQITKDGKKKLVKRVAKIIKFVRSGKDKKEALSSY